MDQRVTAEWQPAYSVGNRLMDEQHQRLLRLCADANMCMAAEGREAVQQFHAILSELSDYVNRHFVAEEALLRAANFPGAAEHAAEHLEYRMKLTEMLLDAITGQIDKAELSRYLTEWWLHHILVEDMKYKGRL